MNEVSSLPSVRRCRRHRPTSEPDDVPPQEILLLTVVNVSCASNIRPFDPAQLSKGLPLIPVGESIHGAPNRQKHQMNGKWSYLELTLPPFGRKTRKTPQ
jgi:hypothetical protein